jgi:protein tyrosine phosphatase (PTP) superfamily phosphohydrolase (DUF442 family)
MTRRTHFAASTTLLIFALATGCAQPAASANANVQLTTEPPPAIGVDKPVERPGAHNIVTYADGLICGGAPEGETGLRSLAAMGVRTVISVDGSLPDVGTAQKLGMRYVHLPISYSGCSDERALELAQAVANLPGPFYVHCHHGKHRSAGALAVAALMTGRMTQEQVLERMKVSGTSPDYQGLWALARNTKLAAADQLKADPATFPAICKPNGTVAIMTEIDLVNDNLKAVQKAKWQVPVDHPDLVPAHESQRLLDLHEQLHGDPGSAAKPAQFLEILDRATRSVRALDAAVRAGDATAAEREFGVVAKSCKECHKTYRDR